MLYFKFGLKLKLQFFVLKSKVILNLNKIKFI